MKRRSLSRDETALWKRATRGVKRLEAGAPVPGPPGLKTGETTRQAMFPTTANFEADIGTAPKRSRLKGQTAATKIDPHTVRSRGPGSAFAAGDPALDRRARRGRLAPERTIDLHGMTQVAARVALAAFLERAHKDQCRCVLVVTGKGAGALERAGLDERAPRGVIRRRFQEWLDEEPLRSMVARAAPAAPKDGGAGAFYVFLKRGKARL